MNKNWVVVVMTGLGKRRYEFYSTYEEAKRRQFNLGRRGILANVWEASEYGDDIGEV